MQSFIATGHLGGDVEMRYQPNGDAVANFSLAVSKRYTNKDGQKVEKTIWIRVGVWRQLAENCSKYLHKGSKVLVDGELEPINVFTKKDGTAGASYEMTAQSVEFLDSKQDATDTASTTQAPSKAAHDEVVPF